MRKREIKKDREKEREREGEGGREREREQRVRATLNNVYRPNRPETQQSIHGIPKDL